MLKNQAVSWISKNLFDSVTYTVRNGLNKGLRRRGGLGWLPFESNDTPELRFWKQLDLDGKVVYDVGAFHGLLTIYFARRARMVVAWEPNSRNRQRLNENVRLNAFRNVIVRPYGLSSEPMRAKMSFDPLAPGRASIDARIAGGAQEEIVEIRMLDQEEGLEKPDLIKIDVEGFELNVLDGGIRTLERHPALFLEMHGADPADKRERVKAIVNRLWSLGYHNIVHVESGVQIAPENTGLAAQGHLYVRAS
ncbi:MAG: FkbM family methyltransferase [Bryobacteraceae bacterium]|jgi:FkbM family methyltransferase